MTDYSRQQDFTAKDALATGNPLKKIKGQDVDQEFDAIVTSIATKVDGPSSPSEDDVLVFDGTNWIAEARGFVQSLGEVAPANDLTMIIGALASTTVAISADQIMMFKPGTNGYQVVVPPVTVSPNITVSGIDGLDTGAETSDTWYHCFMVWNGITPLAASNFKGLFSISATAPALGSYTHQAYCGAVYNGATSSFTKFSQSGSLALGTREQALVAGAATTWTLVDLSAFVPPTAKSVLLELRVSNTTSDATANCDVAAEDDGVGVARVRNPGNGTEAISGQVEIPLVTDQNVWYQVGDTDERVTIVVTGWRY